MFLDVRGGWRLYKIKFRKLDVSTKCSKCGASQPVVNRHKMKTFLIPARKTVVEKAGFHVHTCLYINIVATLFVVDEGCMKSNWRSWMFHYNVLSVVPHHLVGPPGKTKNKQLVAINALWRCFSSQREARIYFHPQRHPQVQSSYLKLTICNWTDFKTWSVIVISSICMIFQRFFLSINILLIICIHYLCLFKIEVLSVEYYIISSKCDT